MVMAHLKNMGQNHNLLITNKSYKNVAKFKCLGTTIRKKIAFTKKLRPD